MRKDACFIIAEAGVNHNGHLDTAKHLVDAAQRAGADAIKFQTFRAERLVTAEAAKAPYQIQNTGGVESQLEMLKKLELSEADHRELISYCKEKEITYISTPFDETSADMLDDLGMAIFKIGSGEITNKPLLQHVARKNKPMILSTGMSYLEEVAKSVRWIQEAGIVVVEKSACSDDWFPYSLVLLHCVTDYPALPQEANLLSMKTMRDTLKLPVGYSDHTVGIEISIAAVVMGAVVVEKHLTLSRTMDGPDHRASLEPVEFAALVGAVRNVEMAMGDGIKKPSGREERMRNVVRRSLVATRDLKAGDIFCASDIMAKRPADGISPEFRELVIGMRAIRDIRCDTVLKWDDLKHA
jgi:N-acetylneuraminate synthase